MQKILGSLPLIALLFGCAHHDDVRPGDGGLHYVRLNTDDALGKVYTVEMKFRCK